MRQVGLQGTGGVVGYEFCGLGEKFSWSKLCLIAKRQYFTIFWQSTKHDLVDQIVLHLKKICSKYSVFWWGGSPL